MRFFKKFATLAVCAVMTVSTAMSMTVSATDTTEQPTLLSESANDTITVINSICAFYDNYAVTQVGNGSCWAACILSVLKYHDFRTTETFESIYTRANRLTGSNMSVGDSIITSKMQVVVNNYLGMDNVPWRQMLDGMIYKHIGANEPLIGRYQSGQNTFHDVVIYGFEGKRLDNGFFYIEKFRIMDPWTGTCKTINMYDYTWDGFYCYTNLC